MNGAEVRDYAESAVAEALETQREAENAPESPDVDDEDNAEDGDDDGESCGMHTEECDTNARVAAIRGLLDHPHGDDSPCMNPVWGAADAVLNQALSGIESTLALE